jgi:hypothetical protein
MRQGLLVMGDTPIPTDVQYLYVCDPALASGVHTIRALFDLARPHQHYHFFILIFLFAQLTTTRSGRASTAGSPAWLSRILHGHAKPDEIRRVQCEAPQPLPACLNLAPFVPGVASVLSTLKTYYAPFRLTVVCLVEKVG